MQDWTRKKVESVIQSVEMGHAAVYCFQLHSISQAAFYQAMRSDPELKEKYDKARGLAQEMLVNKLIDSNKPQAQMWLLEKCYRRNFGKWADKEAPIDLTDEEKTVLYNDDTETKDKILVITQCFLEGRLSLDTLTALINAYKAADPKYNNSVYVENLADLEVPSNSREVKE